jgi:hypothetical protein
MHCLFEKKLKFRMSNFFNYDLFVSYSWENDEEVCDLCEKLKRKGFKLLFEKIEIPLNNLSIKKKKAIDESLLFMCCVSNRYCKSAGALKEFNYAIETEKKIIYVLFDKLNEKKESVKNFKKIAYNFALQRYYKNLDLNGKLFCNSNEIDLLVKLINEFKKVLINNK